MLKFMRYCLLASLIGLLAACSGGGGNAAEGVEPGPPPSGGPVDPPPPTPSPNPTPFAEAQELIAVIGSVTLNDDDQPVVEFTLADGSNAAITDLAEANVRFVVAKLMASPLGGQTGSWQSYVNRIEEPGVGPGTDDALQATFEFEFGAFGELINNGGGSYTYTFATSLTNIDTDILDQAALEGIDLSYEPSSPHRVSIQFDGGQAAANPYYDWIPGTGATEGIFTMDIAATDSCNNCHDPLMMHGGGRRDMQYCVTCHNPGTTDANSGNNLDMKVMIHKLHMGANLPSVIDGGSYTIWGYQDRPHDYSTLHYPQDIRNCVNCHAGNATGADQPNLTLTAQGDNWTEYPTQAACGSCHDDVDWSIHAGGQTDDSGCSQCHSATEIDIQYSHRMEVMQARETLEASVEDVSNAMPGEKPTVRFRIRNPLTEDDYDIQTDPVFTDPDASLTVGIAWDTGDYHNTGNFDATTSANNANQVQADALADATPNGDGSYSITMPVAIPDGSLDPNVPATGSGIATLDGHPIFELDANNDGEDTMESVSLGDAHRFFSIDEADGEAVDRRTVVTIEQCQSCHQSLVLHGSNRADNIDNCVSCHNPRNTDRRRREQGMTPGSGGSAMATDGKDEESIDFKTMVHAIHAAGMRDDALQIVGYMAYNLHVFDEEQVHYPGNLANCTACHEGNSFALPLAEGVLATSIDTGSERNDPADDTVVTPMSAICASCHDGDDSRVHMEDIGGGNFATTQKAIDDGEVVETCHICHGEGRSSDAWEFHQKFLD
jgi:OmcA/MtrC family decaheme c-type cytochrome